MDVLKKCDAKNHRTFARGTGLPTLRPVIRSGRSSCATIKLESARKSTTRFAEDFYWEHSSASVADILVTIPNRSDSVGPATPRNHYANNINSPNCVYIG
jgi:hypothetical protein